MNFFLLLTPPGLSLGILNNPHRDFDPVGGAGNVVEGKATEKVEKAKTVEIEAPKNQKSAATNRSKNKRKRKGQ